MSQVPDDAVSMPEPASSRDSFKSGNDDFWKYVSTKLQEAWAEIARERFLDLDSWDDFEQMSREEKEALFRAYSEFGPKYSDTTADTIQETLQENLGVSIDGDLGLRLHESKSKVKVVSRGSTRAHTKGALESKAIWKVIDEAPDGVYMGVSVSQKKADIAWDLGETHVVRVDNTEKYGEYSSDWGWSKLKDLPSRNLSEKLPELSDDIIDEYENVSTSQSNNTESTGSTGGDGKNPDTYHLKARVGSNSRKYFTKHKVENLVKILEKGGSFSTGRYSAKYLIIKDTDTSARRVGSIGSRSNNIAATRVPKYVYQYLATVDNVYESQTELYKDLAGTDVTLSDGTTMDIRSVPESDILVNVKSKVEDHFEGRIEELVDLLGYDADDYDRFTFIDASDLGDSWEVQTDATVLKVKGAVGFNQFDDYTYVSKTYRDLLFKDKTSHLDKSSEKYDAMFNRCRHRPSGDTLDTLVEIAEDAGL
jgi:hypothetical protein